MAKHSHPNALYNAGFRFWDYGTSMDIGALPTIPYVANRWKISKTGIVAGTVSKGAGPSGIEIPKWLRSKPALKLDIISMDPGVNVAVTQYVEESERYGQAFAILSTVHTGPAGATIYVGIGDDLRPVQLKGESVQVTTTHSIMIPDLATSTVPVQVFSKPSVIGVYTVNYAQLSLGFDRPRNDGFTIRPEVEDRLLCDRYAYRVTAGTSGPATSTRVSIPIRFTTTMRAIPTITAIASTLSIVDIVTGAITSVNSPALSAATISVNGARLALTNATGLPSSSTQMITTESVAVFHADY
ncbi:hypothetical protein ACLQ8T_05845 [Glutamicibacter sp. FR1]|uniref:hypothetical protein n=1 Tax=Glutamicibacter sp. FR1 TaxID=3393744 RepID=UPI0039AF6F07